MPILFAIISVPIGLFVCFTGYRLFRIASLLLGFVLGAYVGATIAANNGSDTLVTIVLGVIGGLVGVGLMFLLYRFGVFLLGALMGAALGFVLAGALRIGMSEVFWVIVFAAAVAAGVLSYRFERPFMILLTAFLGAAAVVTGVWMVIRNSTDVLVLTRTDPTAQIDPLFLIVWVVLGILGTAFQMGRGVRNRLKGE